MSPSEVEQLWKGMGFNVVSSAARLAQPGLALAQNGRCVVCVCEEGGYGGEGLRVGALSFTHSRHTMSWHCWKCQADCVFL